MIFVASIPSIPRTKKNSGVLNAQVKRVFPSKAYRRWNSEAQAYLAIARAKAGIPLPIREPVGCRALFYVDRDYGGDAVGYYQALADTLEEGGIVANDRLIRHWDGSRVLIDRENPRVDVRITTARGLQ